METRTHFYLLLLLPILVASIFAGTITGTISNGTKGATVPDNLIIELKKYTRSGVDDSFNMQTTLSSDGSFVFNDVPDTEEAIYVPVVYYQGVKYEGTAVQFETQQQESTSKIVIYEPTQSDSSLDIAYHHMLLKAGEGSLEIQEIYVVENRGDRTFVGSPGNSGKKLRTLFFPIPENASQIALQKGLMSCCIETVENGFYDTMEMLPGRKEIAFSYQLKAPDKTLTLSKEAPLFTRVFDVIPISNQLSIVGDGFQKTALEGTQFLRYTKVDIAPSEEISFVVEGLPGAPVQLRYWFLFAGIIFTGSAIAFLYFRRRKLGTPNPAQETSLSGELISKEREQLLEEIAKLDVAHEAGELEESEYRLRRNELKSLLNLKSQISSKEHV
ncbi:MAG: hypothetical protein D6748_12760 [Calditrichaeota bacterium]|nr:MAG: hypothetical protein D6748_12760 [Calditrichota bacterium]